MIPPLPSHTISFSVTTVQDAFRFIDGPKLTICALKKPANTKRPSVVLALPRSCSRSLDDENAPEIAEDDVPEDESPDFSGGSAISPGLATAGLAFLAAMLR